MGVPPTAQQQAKGQGNGGRKRPEPIDHGEGSLAGNLTRDPELKYTAKGVAVASMRVARTPRIRDPKTGEWKDGETEFYDVTAWAQLAEMVVEHLGKGDRIVAEGRFEEQSWETDDGEIRSKLVLMATDLGPSMRFSGARIVRRQAARAAS